MLSVYLFLAALLALPSLARAQDTDSDGGAPRAETPAPAPERVAVPRGSRPQGDNPRIGTAMPRTVTRVAPSREAPPAAVSAQAPGGPLRSASAQDQEQSEPERRAVPRGSRPQGDNPRTGTAVPRSAPPPRSGPPGGGITSDRGRTAVVPNRGRTVIVRPPSYGYYYPRGYYPYAYGAYPYGYGAFGLGYFYYNPYRWYSGYAPGFSTYGYYDGYRRGFGTFDIGEVRLDVSPRNAQVYVDGYYAGVVDDYDGAFQALKLESGTYRIEITAPGFETLSFDVRITPGQKIRYQGDLRRLP